MYIWVSGGFAGQGKKGKTALPTLVCPCFESNLLSQWHHGLAVWRNNFEAHKRLGFGERGVAAVMFR